MLLDQGNPEKGMRTDPDPIHPRLIHHRAKLRKGIRSAHRKGPIVADQAPSAEEAHGEPCQEIRVPAPEEIVHNESRPSDPIQGGSVSLGVGAMTLTFQRDTEFVTRIEYLS